VLVDYCHNPAGMVALADFIRRPEPQRSLAMIAIPGDRRDEDIRAFGRIAGGAFDGVIVREDTKHARAGTRRGRGDPARRPARSGAGPGADQHRDGRG